MAARSSHPKAHFAYSELLFIPIDISIGSSGAPSLTASTSHYVKSISRTSTGSYTLTLGDPSSTHPEVFKYKRAAHFDGVVLYSNSGSPSAVIAVQPVTDTLSSNGQMTFVCASATGTAADPESGSTLKLLLIIKPN